MTFALVLFAGALLAAGLVALVAAAVPVAPQLDAALDRAGEPGRGADRRRDAGPVTSR